MYNFDYQPTGFKALGWGLLGFMGGNVIINTICLIGISFIDYQHWNPLIVLLVTGFFITVAFWAAYEFKLTREYKATRIGITTAMWTQGIVTVLAVIGALA